MGENLGEIDQKEEELANSRKLTEEIAIDLLNNEVKNNLRMSQFDQAGEYQEILNVLKAETGLISDLDWKQFKDLKILWQAQLRQLAVRDVRNKKDKVDQNEKITVVTEEVAKRAASTDDQIEEEQANGNGAA